MKEALAKGYFLIGLMIYLYELLSGSVMTIGASLFTKFIFTRSERVIFKKSLICLPFNPTSTSGQSTNADRDVFA